ncbi:MAG: hypothetical protein R2738_00065 [Bacteroides graminisolvens]
MKDSTETNWIWNAQIAKTSSKKQATISLQIEDILKESNLSRSISASMRQDTEYNAINSYFMVHFVYRLNAFGKGNSRGGFDGPARADAAVVVASEEVVRFKNEQTS